MLKLVQSAQAEQDLIDIWVYTAEQWSLSQADAYLDQLGSGMRELETHPQLGHARDDIRLGYRSLTVGQHVMFYKLTDAEIQIVRVLHKAVDVQRHL